MREASALQLEVLPLWPMWCSVRQQECLAIARHDGIIAYCHLGDCFGLDTKIPKNGPIFSPEKFKSHFRERCFYILSRAWDREIKSESP